MSAAATGVRAALWVVSLTLGILSLWSVLRQPLTTVEAATLCVFAGVALVRPLDALLIFAALGPLISVIGVIFGFPFTGSRLLETFVLLLLVPWTARQARWIRSARWRSLDWALLGFAAIVASSAAAHLPVLALRTGGDRPARALWEYLTTAYLTRSPGFDVVNEAVLLLEGIGLCAMISRLALDFRNAERITAMAIAGAAGAAAMNAYRLFEIALRRGPLAETLGEILMTVRINTQFGDVNAAGSYFAMAFVVALGLSDLRSRRGGSFAVAAAVLGLAVWLSGSRTALLGAVLGIVAVLLFRHRERAWNLMRPRRVLISAGALAIAVIAVVVVYPRARNVSVQYSVWARVELTAAAMRMVADRPLLGVGVSRFYELFPRYASPELRQKFFESALTPVTRENAHNNFLQILAELGIAGLVAFLAVLWLALRADRENRHTARLPTAVRVGLATFLFTALFGHPLLTHEVAYPFWILLGVSAAGAADPSGRGSSSLRRALAVLTVALIASVPVRAAYEKREATLEGVALGMSNWRADEAGNRFRWAGLRSTLFIEAHAPVLTLPLKASGDTSCTVEISIEGRVADRVVVPGDQWREVRLRLPPNTGRRSSRLDFTVGGDCAAGIKDSTQALMVGRPGELGGSSGAPLPR